MDTAGQGLAWYEGSWLGALGWGWHSLPRSHCLKKKRLRTTGLSLSIYETLSPKTKPHLHKIRQRSMRSWKVTTSLCRHHPTSNSQHGAETPEAEQPNFRRSSYSVSSFRYRCILFIKLIQKLLYFALVLARSPVDSFPGGGGSPSVRSEDLATLFARRPPVHIAYRSR